MTTAPPNLKSSPHGLCSADLPDGIPLPPTNLDSDEPPLESSLHLSQLILLLACLNWLWKSRDN